MTTSTMSTTPSLSLIHILDCGVGGVTMGRFVWDYPDVTALVVALRYLIHHGYSVKETKELLAQLENDKNYDQF